MSKLPPNLQIINDKIDQLATSISKLSLDVKEMKDKYNNYEVIDESANYVKPASFWEGYWSPGLRT